MIEFHFFWNANENFRVAEKNKGRSGNRKHTLIFFALALGHSNNNMNKINSATAEKNDHKK